MGLLNVSKHYPLTVHPRTAHHHTTRLHDHYTRTGHSVTVTVANSTTKTNNTPTRITSKNTEQGKTNRSKTQQLDNNQKTATVTRSRANTITREQYPQGVQTSPPVLKTSPPMLLANNKPTRKNKVTGSSVVVSVVSGEGNRKHPAEGMGVPPRGPRLSPPRGAVNRSLCKTRSITPPLFIGYFLAVLACLRRFDGLTAPLGVTVRVAQVSPLEAVLWWLFLTRLNLPNVFAESVRVVVMELDKLTRSELSQLIKAATDQLATLPPRCVQCGDVFTPTRAHALTCSPRCRVAKHTRRAHPHPPEFLTSRPRWVLHTPNKLPVSAVTGKAASVTKPNTWTDYETATKRLADFPGYGLGFVLTGDGIGCYDLDNVATGNDLTAKGLEWVSQITERVLFAELSPSRRGVHVWVEAETSRGRVFTKGFERYTTGRYLTVTNHRLSVDALRAGVVDNT